MSMLDLALKRVYLKAMNKFIGLAGVTGLLLVISIAEASRAPLEKKADFFCESRRGAYTECPTKFVIDTVKLDLELSEKRCKEHLTWGYGYDYIWVNEHCRGSFKVLSKK